MIRDPAADRRAGERAQELRARVDADRSTARSRRRVLGNQRGQHGLEEIERGEEHRQRDAQRNQRVQRKRERAAATNSTATRSMRGLPRPGPVDVAQERQHDANRHHKHGQIDDPMALGRKAVVAQRKRNLREQRHQRGVQGEGAVVEAQELRVAGDARELARRRSRSVAALSGTGTAKRTTAMAASASAPVSAKMPGTPIAPRARARGPARRRRWRAIVMPMTAMARGAHRVASEIGGQAQ